LAEPSEKLFGNFVDYQRDFVKTTILIDKLRETAHVQLKADEQMVVLLEDQKRDARDRFEKQLQEMEKQVDAINGVNTSVVSVSVAVQNVEAAIGRLAGFVNAALAVQASSAIQAPVPKFSSGGFHGGGLRIVGENGPELEATGPSQIFSHNDTMSMISNKPLVDELRELRKEVSRMRDEQRQLGIQTATSTDRNYKLLRSWDAIGLPEERVA
jgi:hypothetical protein